MKQELLNFTGRDIAPDIQAVDVVECPGLRRRINLPDTINDDVRYLFICKDEPNITAKCPVGKKDIFIERVGEGKGTMDCSGCPYFNNIFTIFVSLMEIEDISVLNENNTDHEQSIDPSV